MLLPVWLIFYCLFAKISRRISPNAPPIHVDFTFSTSPYGYLLAFAVSPQLGSIIFYSL